MNEIYKDKLISLRQRIPVGLNYGLKLLERTNGDLEKAEQQFKGEMITLAINKTGVTSEVATIHLTKKGFDLGLAIKSIEEELKSIEDERYTFTELILRKHKNKEDALNKIMYAVEEQYNLKREFWLDVECLKGLPAEIYKIIVILEWLNYEDWEGYDYALSFNLNLVTEQIKNQLALTDLANSLEHANDIKNIIYAKHETKRDFQNYINAGNELRENEEYQKCEEVFKDQRPLLIERLYEFVKDNKAQYP